MKKEILTSSLLMSSLLLAACSNSVGDLENYVDNIKAQPSNFVLEVIEPPVYRPFEYPGHDNDPFDTSVLAAKISPEQQKASNGIKIDENRTKQYLEGFPLDTLRMVGTLSRGGSLWALIQTPDNTIQRASVDAYLGQNNGKIIQIASNKVEITEIVPDNFGGFKERPASIALSDR